MTKTSAPTPWPCFNSDKSELIEGNLRSASEYVESINQSISDTVRPFKCDSLEKSASQRKLNARD